MYKAILKPVLFLLPAEKAHQLTVTLLQWVLSIPLINSLFRSFYQLDSPLLQREVMGLSFKNPIGLAAGFDKDGKYFKSMASLGFGFIEVGTVTPKGQEGNPQPRLFRLPADQALINRMGFNNEGVEALISRLRQGKIENVIIGGNIGKNKITPNDQANQDYVDCFEALFPYVDYFVVNVSSPNTPNLRDLQEKAPLTALLSQLQDLNRQQTHPKPMLLKIAPDLTNGQLDDIIDIIVTTGIDGIIATNTTISREGLQTPSSNLDTIGAGGLSGQPVKQRSTEVIRYLRNKLPEQTVIIGVGGIHSAKDALEKLGAGADLIQIYTGLIYEGPGLLKKIKQALLST
ncbi:MAG: quinone-dependent dihydroorotate dehydrogenase [Saprospiraceae bacterium]